MVRREHPEYAGTWTTCGPPPARHRGRPLAARHTRPMSSSNGIDIDTELEIYRLADEGLSSRQIAKATGVPRSTVKRRIDARAAVLLEYDDDDELDDLDLDRLAPDIGYVATPPFTFVGMEPTELDTPGCDPVEPVLVERFLDGNDRSVSLADLYRADFQDGSGGSRLPR